MQVLSTLCSITAKFEDSTAVFADFVCVPGELSTADFKMVHGERVTFAVDNCHCFSSFCSPVTP